MGSCWNCKADVFLKDEEVRCDKCKEIIRYWCNSCAKPFDVQDKETKKKVRECKWCGYFLCPNCNACRSDCQKNEHIAFIKKTLAGIIPLDKLNQLHSKAQKIVDYFEEIKMGRVKTTCEFGVPKTYAKERIKQILARTDGYKVRDATDKKAFEDKLKEVSEEDIEYEFTIGNTRKNGTYGQEYRDIFNFCICLGTLKYESKEFTNDKGLKIGYDSWTRIEENPCPYLDIKEIIVKYCPQCSKTFTRDKEFCDECSYKKNRGEFKKGDLKNVALKEKLSDIPTCKNIQNFKQDWEEESGKGNFEGES